MMKPYFAYGSNLLLKQMKDRCPDHRIIGKGILKGYCWIISTRGFANIITSNCDEVHGVVYEISESDEKSLDYYEGADRGYRKEMVTIELGNQKKNCLVYIDPITTEGRPKKEYIERINGGIIDSELSTEYVDRYMRKFVPA